MPGTWKIGDITRKDQRPGFYTRFVAQAELAVAGGQTGIVACATISDFGPLASVRRLNTIGEFERLYQDTFSPVPSNANHIVRNIFLGGARNVLFYRIGGTAAAKALRDLEDTEATPRDILTLTAKYEGNRGNGFRISVIIVAMKVTITLIDSDNTVLTSWTREENNGTVDLVEDFVDDINNDEDNIWVDASTNVGGTGSSAITNDTTSNTFAVQSVASFSGGVNPTVADADWEDARSAFENEDFSTAYFDVSPTDNTTVWESTRDWVTEIRDTIRDIIWVTGSDSADTLDQALTAASNVNEPGIVYIHPGWSTRSNNAVNERDAYKQASRIAGLIAGLPLSQSLSYRALGFIEDLSVRYGNADIKRMIAGGIMPIVYDGRNFKIERGVNTLTVLGDNQDNSFKKIKTIRILDGINNALNASTADNIIGKIDNDRDGRSVVLGAYSGFLDGQANLGLIEDDFNVETDPDNEPTLDRYFVRYGIRPIDSIEYVYNTIEIL